MSQGRALRFALGAAALGAAGALALRFIGRRLGSLSDEHSKDSLPGPEAVKTPAKVRASPSSCAHDAPARACSVLAATVAACSEPGGFG
jgi:hypothetical protein